jgi:hypothetical protein
MVFPAGEEVLLLAYLYADLYARKSGGSAHFGKIFLGKDFVKAFGSLEFGVFLSSQKRSS